MTTIEDKINLFSKILYEKVNEEKEERLKVFNQEAQKKLAEQRQKINESRKNLRIEFEKRYNIKANEIIAKEKLNKQRAILNVKDELIKDVLLQVRSKLTKFADSEGYREYLLSSFMKVMDNLEEGNYYLDITHKDYEKFEKDIKLIIGKYENKKMEIRISESDMIGGVIIKDFQSTFKVDSSLYCKLEDSQEFAGIKVMEMLA